jgi:hypothetical protein
VAYAAEWDLDDHVLDREEVEAVVAHVAAIGQVSAEVTRGRRGLFCTFRFPVSAAADIVSALDPTGELLGDDWWRDLDPPLDGDDGYFVRVELLGTVDGGLVDDDDEDDDERDLDEGDTPDEDEPAANDDEITDVEDATSADGCVARLRLESADNREAWPVAFALASAIVDRLGGDLRDEVDEELYELQRHVPAIVVRTADGAQVIGHVSSSDAPAEADAPERPDTIDEELLN